jgi:hypothetical protein
MLKDFRERMLADLQHLNALLAVKKLVCVCLGICTVSVLHRLPSIL